MIYAQLILGLRSPYSGCAHKQRDGEVQSPQTNTKSVCPMTHAPHCISRRGFADANSSGLAHYQLYQAQLPAARYGCRPIAHVEFLVDARGVRANGTHGYYERFGDLAIGLAL